VLVQQTKSIQSAFNDLLYFFLLFPITSTYLLVVRVSQGVRGRHHQRLFPHFNPFNLNAKPDFVTHQREERNKLFISSSLQAMDTSRNSEVEEVFDVPYSPSCGECGTRVSHTGESMEAQISHPRGNNYEDVTECADSAYMNAVVKVFCIRTEPNYSLPWQRKRQSTSTSTGFAIVGKRLVTNAHSVEHYTQVKVKKRGDETKYSAKVMSVGNECDLALLTVEDDSFWEDMTFLEFGALPRLQDSVLAIGYPIGGDTVSVTSGVVSRIEVTSYVHGASELLGVQVDAAINAGNSGGPALNNDGKCVGVAFQVHRLPSARDRVAEDGEPIFACLTWYAGGRKGSADLPCRTPDFRVPHVEEGRYSA